MRSRIKVLKANFGELPIKWEAETINRFKSDSEYADAWYCSEPRLAFNRTVALSCSRAITSSNVRPGSISTSRSHRWWFERHRVQASRTREHSGRHDRRPFRGFPADVIRVPWLA